MAGITLPNVVQNVTNALVAIGTTVPTAKFESVCLSVTLKSGTADAYVDVYLNDTLATNEGYVRWQEPVRYRQPGGSPDLLLNFILNAGQQLQVAASTTGIMDACLFNRYQFDA
jgi:hypothetical protein